MHIIKGKMRTYENWREYVECETITIQWESYECACKRINYLFYSMNKQWPTVKRITFCTQNS